MEQAIRALTRKDLIVLIEEQQGALMIEVKFVEGNDLRGIGIKVEKEHLEMHKESILRQLKSIIEGVIPEELQGKENVIME